MEKSLDVAAQTYYIVILFFMSKTNFLRDEYNADPFSCVYHPVVRACFQFNAFI